MGILKAIFNLALREEYIPHMPFKGIVIGKSRPNTRYRSREEIGALIKASDEDPLYQGYILFLLYTGCRSGELKNLKWDDIWAHHIEFNGKTGRRDFLLSSQVQ